MKIQADIEKTLLQGLGIGTKVKFLPEYSMTRDGESEHWVISGEYWLNGALVYYTLRNLDTSRLTHFVGGHKIIRYEDTRGN